MYYILLGIIVTLSFFESVFERNKFKGLFFFIASIVFVVIQCFNLWAPDLESYAIHFELIDREYVRNPLEPVHIFLIETVKGLGGSFYDFLKVYGLLIMLPFLYFIKKYSPLPVFVLSIFFVIPFFPDITQIRVFLAFSVFLTSLHFYHTKRVIFYVLYGLAVFCHFSLLVFLVFLILRRFSFFHNLRKSNVIIGIGVALLAVIPKSVASVVVMSVNSKYGSYLEGTETYIGTIALFLPFFVINCFVINHYNRNKNFIKDKVNVKYSKQLPLFMELIMFSNYLILIQYFIRDFSRITMNLSILSYIYISILLFYGYGNRVKSKKMATIVLRYSVYIWVILTFYITFLMLNNGVYMEIIEKTFSRNSFYGS